MKVMIDTNIALDVLLDRKPFVLDSLQILALAEADKLELLLSTDSISTIFYLISKNKNTRTGRQAVVTLLDYVSLVSLDGHSVIKGLAFDFTDLEDALIASVADAAQAKAIVTRNVKDFKNSPIPALAPREFLSFWEKRKDF